MKKLIIAGLVLLLLLAGAGAFFYFKKGFGDARASSQAKETEAHKVVAVKLPFLPVPIVEQGEVRRYALVGVTLDMSSDADADAMKAELPRIVDAFLGAMHSDPDGRETTDLTTDPNSLTPRLQTALNTFEIGRRVRALEISPVRPAQR